MSSPSESFQKELENKEQPALTQAVIISLAWCLSLSLFWVIFLWRFWEKDVYALGLNACVFFLGLFALFFRPLYQEKRIKRKDLYWLVPLVIIPFSYLFYANPFIKAINIFVYPLLGFLFINYSHLQAKETRYWGINFITHFIARFFSFFKKIPAAGKAFVAMASPKSRGQGTARRIVIGSILLLLIAITVVIPLLSAADPVFGDKLAFIYDLIKQYIGESVLSKTAFFLAFALFLASTALAWIKNFDYPENDEAKKPTDSIVAGIVLGGILGLYLLFLWVQAERLWIGGLPFEFKETEALVKSGFWQLFFLTGLNALLYFFTYRRTNPVVQKILAAFTGASLLLLVSAGQRMALYVVNYGFSYEKFFAFYTVIYSAVLFVWLFACLFRKERANILKFMAFLFLWMYAAITILPMEQFIMRANVALAKRPETHINLYELTILSPDVLSLVKQYQREGDLNDDWQAWIDKQEKRLADKRWYEFNF